MTYGALDLSDQTLALLGVVAVLLFCGAGVAYGLGTPKLAVMIQLVTCTPVTILIVTWLTQIDNAGWDDAGPIPVICSIFMYAAVLFGPLYVGDIIDDIVDS